MADPSGRLKEIIDDISLKHGGKTPAQIALNWLLSRGKGIFPIPRASRPERVVEDVGSVGWNLDSDDIARLEGYPFELQRQVAYAQQH